MWKWLESRPEGELWSGIRGRTMKRLEQGETTECLSYQTWLTLYPTSFTLLPEVFKIQPYN